jgi:hypothetical protein
MIEPVPPFPFIPPRLPVLGERANGALAGAHKARKGITLCTCNGGSPYRRGTGAEVSPPRHSGCAAMRGGAIIAAGLGHQDDFRPRIAGAHPTRRAIGSGTLSRAKRLSHGQ